MWNETPGRRFTLDIISSCVPSSIFLCIWEILWVHQKRQLFFPWKISDASGGSQTKALSRHLDYTISQQVSLFFEEERREKEWKQEYKYKEHWLHCKESCWCLLFQIAQQLPQCGTWGSNEESGLPHDQLLHLSNLQHHQLLASDLSPWNISFHPHFCFASSVPCKLLLHTFGPPNAHLSRLK